MRRVEITCDVCGTVKANANHWFAILSSTDHTDFVIEPKYSPSDWEESEYNRVVDLCGESCVLRRVAELIAPPKTEVAT